MPKFLHNGTEVTAGQALDVWLQSERVVLSSDRADIHIHFFADACEGFRLEVATLAEAGIEIQFGEKA